MGAGPTSPQNRTAPNSWRPPIPATAWDCCARCWALAGRYGSTLDYARETHASLRAHGVDDRRLAALLAHAPTPHGA